MELRFFCEIQGSNDMKKFLVMPDSFKGTMNAVEVCDIIGQGLQDRFPDARITKVPLADGGEGTVDSYLHAFGGQKVFVRVTGPFGEKTDGYYGRYGDTAVIEMAAAAGYVMAGRRKDPATATTYGVGELIKAAVTAGCREIILGLGGSCTNDGGAGMAAALGTRFYDKDDELFVPTGNTLCRIKRIDTAVSDRLLDGISITAMCDVKNMLYGRNGAAYVFSPQKGADAEMVRELDYNLRCFAETVKTSLDTDISTIKCGGAAGGMGAGTLVFLHATLKSGIDVILDVLDFETILPEYNAVFTGEGQFDMQSLNGKVVTGISRRAAKFKVPVITIAGSVRDVGVDIGRLGISAVYQAASSEYDSFEELSRNCRDDLYRAAVRAADDPHIL